MKSTKKRSSFSMQETDEAEEENEGLSDRQKQIREGGAVVTKNRKHTIQCLTVIGQIEGHYVAPSQNKTTKYEHVIPQIVSVEEDPNIDGLLMILNTVGGDVEAVLPLQSLSPACASPRCHSFSAADIPSACRLQWRQSTRSSRPRHP